RGCDLRAESCREAIFVYDQTAPRSLDRSEHRLAIPGGNGAQIDELCVDAGLLDGKLATLHECSPAHDRDCRAGPNNLGLPHRKHVRISGIRTARPGSIEDVAMLEENSRIIAAHRSAQQSYRIFGIGGITNLPADGMRP